MKNNILNLIDFGCDSEEKTVSIEKISKTDIAVVGMSLKLPKVNSLEQFWNIIRNKKDCIGDVSDERKKDLDSLIATNSELSKNAEYAKGGYLNEIDKFDYRFFHISPKEACLMDPNQRMFLEVCWNALEDAGYGGDTIKGSSTGVFVGFRNDDLYTYKRYLECSVNPIDGSIVPGNMSSIIASRISYLLNFNGPAIVIDTACSSSLVAVHYACCALRNGECNMAIAGGIRINFVPIKNKLKLGIESIDGRTRAFDDTSDGTGWGEGVSAIVLKPLNKAIKDRDNIHAVIKGSAINQDGNSVGLTAPNALAQENVIEKAWKDSKIDPESISYIEAHGTGTGLGDPIEIDGINRAFLKYTQRKQFCGIGSVKSNIGHLDCASGLIGLIKTILSLKHKELPPTMHFSRPNSKIDFIDSPVFISDQLSKWESDDGGPLRSGVSSFGMSGTNCHVIVEEAPPLPNEKKTDLNNLFTLTLSAASLCALQQLVNMYKKKIADQPDISLADLCYSANTGRGQYSYRLMITFTNRNQLIEKLSICDIADVLNVEKKGIYVGYFKMVSDKKPVKEPGDITVKELREMNSQVEAILDRDEFMDFGNLNQLDQLGSLYSKGAFVDWSKYYKKGLFHKLSLPTYPFEKSRCWIRIKPSPFSMNKDHFIQDIEKEQSNNENAFFNINYIREDLDENLQITEYSNILVFKNNTRICNRLVDRLKTQNRHINIIEITSGQEFHQIDKFMFSVGPSYDDYHKLFKTLNGINVDQIVHLFSLDTNEVRECADVDNNLNMGMYSLFYILKAIHSCKWDHSLSMVLISDSVHQVTGREALKPINACFFGLAKTIESEYTNIKVKKIDVDEDISIDHLFTEIKNDSVKNLVVYRENSRYIEEFDTLSVQTDSAQLQIKDTGVYIITGGAGGIGLEICKYLSSKSNVNIALINRSAFPDRDGWDTIIQKKSDSKLIDKIKAIREIEKSGSSMHFFNADISDKESVSAIIDHLRTRFQKLNGIIHSAGVVGSGVLSDIKLDSFHKVISPKVHGTWVLDEVTKDDRLDFFILFSSVISIYGGIGQGDYAAANSFLDAYAYYRSSQNKKTIAINWPAWKETGMAVDMGVLTTKGPFNALCTAEGIELFNRILHGKESRVIAGNLDYSVIANLRNKLTFSISKQLATILDKKIDEIEKDNENLNKSLVIKGKKTEELSDLEINIAQILARNLVLEEIDIYDHFTDIGIDSVLMLSIYNEIENAYSGLISLKDMIQLDTIADLTQHLEKQLNNPGNATKKDRYTVIRDTDMNFFIECIPNGIFNSNCYVVGINGNGIIIDAGSSVNRIMDTVQDNDLTVQHIILTHAHVDHILVAEELRKITNARMLIGEYDEQMLNDVEYNGSLLFKNRYGTIHADQLLSDTDDISIEGLTMKVFHTPGHTKGSICIECNGFLFTGDLLFKNGIGNIDQKYGNKEDFNKSILTIMEFNDFMTVLPGHGDITSIGDVRANNSSVIAIINA